MAVDFRAFWLPRRGNSPEQYEDAYAANAAAGRYAVADGASESAFAQSWARVLVEGFVENAEVDPDRWAGTLSTLQQQWSADVHSRPIPWYGQAGLKQGAFATFLGLQLKETSETAYEWQAVAVGDSCLFHTRGAVLQTAFPLDESGQFDSVPKLVGSRMWPGLCESQAVRKQGSGRPDDRLWMMTDALAHWCLVEHEAKRNPWEQMQSLLASPEAERRFAPWVEKLRDAGRLRNDDVTLLVVNL